MYRLVRAGTDRYIKNVIKNRYFLILPKLYLIKKKSKLKNVKKIYFQIYYQYIIL